MNVCFYALIALAYNQMNEEEITFPFMYKKPHSYKEIYIFLLFFK